jgi:inhibitor of cysteine peptidase
MQDAVTIQLKGGTSSSVAVPVGTELQVEIPENPTTGFRWELRAEPHAGVEFVKDEFSRKSAGVGAAGTRIWTIKVNGSTNVHLKAILRRPWLPNSAPQDAASAELQVLQDSTNIVAG